MNSTSFEDSSSTLGVVLSATRSVVASIADDLLDYLELENARPLSLAVAMITFLTSLLLYSGFDSGTADMQFEEKAAWIPVFKIFYHLGIDGISMPLIILTTFTTVLVVLAGCGSTVLGLVLMARLDRTRSISMLA